MKVHKRMLNTKRHTVAYLVGNKWVSRAHAVKLAREGKIEGVRVRRGGRDKLHLASLSHHPRLTDLPVKIDTERRFARR